MKYVLTVVLILNSYNISAHHSGKSHNVVDTRTTVVIDSIPLYQFCAENYDVTQEITNCLNGKSWEINTGKKLKNIKQRLDALNDGYTTK